MDDDLLYLSGLTSDGNLYIGPEHGSYKFDFEMKEEDWLQNSIIPRVEKTTGRIYPIGTSKTGHHHYKGSNKDLVTKLDYYNKNPEAVRE
ncbi:MAG: hypothetical protein FK730_12795, partial [Asgard group archaeon]|nr:hypothetical protein [Asgard group archaeon]